MKKVIYTVFDRKLNEHAQLVMLSEAEVQTFFEQLADDVTNPIYRHLSDFDVYQVATFDTENCTFDDFVMILKGSLKDYQDEDRKHLNIITQTLNFLPTGYFRMPKEMQERIEQDIKDCAKDYVENYMSKDMVKAIGEVSNDEVNNHDN